MKDNDNYVTANLAYCPCDCILYNVKLRVSVIFITYGFLFWSVVSLLCYQHPSSCKRSAFVRRCVVRRLIVSLSLNRSNFHAGVMFEQHIRPQDGFRTLLQYQEKACFNEICTVTETPETPLKGCSRCKRVKSAVSTQFFAKLV